MIYLFLSILSSTAIALLFKFFERKKLDGFQAIVFNYPVCAAAGYYFSEGNLELTSSGVPPWLLYAFLVGFLFIAVFFLIARSVMVSGVTVTVVAQKMSVAIPVVMAFFLFGDSLGFMKIVGILFALPAVWVTAMQPGSGQNPAGSGSSSLFLPLIIFLGSGLADVLLKYAQHHHLNEAEFPAFIMALFATSCLIGFASWFIQLKRGKIQPGLRHVLAGIALGIPNYFSVHFFLRALSSPGMESSVAFPVAHIGVVGLSTLGAVLIFREGLNRSKITGLVLALLAILFFTGAG